VIASLDVGSVSTTLNVYVLNTALSAAIALAKSDVQVMSIVPDPWGPPGQMTASLVGASRSFVLCDVCRRDVRFARCSMEPMERSMWRMRQLARLARASGYEVVMSNAPVR
jgi:hypothetical protein